MTALLLAVQRWLEIIFIVIAGIAMTVMMFAISADAIGRYLFRNPIVGTYELVSLYLMVVITFAAAARTYSTGGQIRMEILLGWMRRKTNGAIDRVISAVSAAGLGVLVYFSSIEALHRISILQTSFGVIQFPLYLSYVWVPVGCGLLFLRLVLDVLLGPQAEDE
jgi:TRAP-type C4-dicarboxylate transport system permease small subunit